MSKTVMIIDDDVNGVKFLTVVLTEAGYGTLSAHNGKEGLELLKESEVDLIVLDVMMPKKTGFSVFKSLKKDERLKDIPVLMLTGVADSLAEMDGEADDTEARPYDALRESLRRTIQEMRSEGDIRPEMFVDKPVDPAAFIERVESLLN